MRNVFMFVLALASLFVSCKKDELEIAPLASVNVINAVLDGKTIKLNSGTRDSSLAFNAKMFDVYSGESRLYLYPVGDSLNPYFNGVKQLITGGIYSLYLSGTSKAPDTTWVVESFPAYYRDSSIGVRLVNLCNDGGALSLGVAADASNNLVSDIAYRNFSDFVKLPLRTVVPAGTMVFQVRDANKAVLATYTLPATANSVYRNISIRNSRNRNLTLVIKGQRGVTSGVNALGLFPVMSY